MTKNFVAAAIALFMLGGLAGYQINAFATPMVQSKAEAISVDELMKNFRILPEMHVENVV
jgi:hypothetical protein